MSTDIIGADQGLAPVMADVRRAARSEANVLIRGETGTGKELISRALHQESKRSAGPFVVANCAAIPTELMESELFGHVRGAFTGAVSDHPGYFEIAADGSLLLDEIGDLHPHLQAKILRVVEEGSFRRVGSPLSRRSRTRILAATNQPLEELIRRHTFRADLFFRLEVISIYVPPLRERRRDIPHLTAHFLVGAARRERLTVPTLSGEAMDALIEHAWPGNVRELRNSAERMVLSGRSIFRRADVERILHRGAPAADTLDLTLRGAEKRAIMRALALHDGNRTHAARTLAIGRRTLQMKIREFGLETDQAKG